jgi:hypothetical protein
VKIDPALAHSARNLPKKTEVRRFPQQEARSQRRKGDLQPANATMRLNRAKGGRSPFRLDAASLDSTKQKEASAAKAKIKATSSGCAGRASSDEARTSLQWHGYQPRYRVGSVAKDISRFSVFRFAVCLPDSDCRPCSPQSACAVGPATFTGALPPTTAFYLHISRGRFALALALAPRVARTQSPRFRNDMR